ncbi:hypothetical protein [uncultured Tateyamaria sp.]|uniref:hypothetical protein n=1 Tax=uncultured Tateyamaria sp. TaxID=455651 RepID=UPI00262F8E4E|nr:hypothetical protein [uncultured Tateyamaria sp.]
MIRAFALVSLLAVSACDQASQAADQLARQSAKSAVTETLATRFPAVPKQAITPFTDCVIDNSSAREITEFAKAAVIGVTDATATQVRTVLGRAETQQCIFRAGLDALTA